MVSAGQSPVRVDNRPPEGWRHNVLRDRKGRALRMAGSMINITGRKMAEEKLLEERHLMRLLIDNVPLNI